MNEYPIFLIISFLMAATAIASLLVKKRSEAANLPPSPPGALPVIGHIHQIYNCLFHRRLAALSAQHGPHILLVRFGSIPTIVISSAEVAEQVFKTHDLCFTARPPSSIADPLTYGSRDLAFAPDGDYWRLVRKLCVSHLLSAKRVRSFERVRQEEMALFLAELSSAAVCNNGTALNLSEMMVSLTNDMICRVALGKKYYSEEKGFKEMLKEMGSCLQCFSMRDCVPWLGFLDEIGGLNSRVRRCFQKLDGFLEQVVEDHIRLQQETGEDKNEHCADFVDILLEVNKENIGHSEFDRGSLKAIINDMFIAGTDTLFNTLEWAMAELLNNPTIMKKAQCEIRQIVGSKPNISDEDRNQMTYLMAVVKETLRLHPPLPMLVPRETRQDVKLHGYDIPKKARVYINIWAIGRDSEYWEKAEQFWPERFILNSTMEDQNSTNPKRDIYYIPFGGGRRGCPGISLSYTTVTFVLANLLCYFNWEIEESNKKQVLDLTEVVCINVRKKFPLLLIPKHV